MPRREQHFFIWIQILSVYDLNSSTTVIRDRRENLHTTLSLAGDLVAVNTHLNEFANYTSCTTFRETLVDFGSTGSAVSITCNVHTTVVVLCELSQSFYVNEIFELSDFSLVDVEEYRYRSSNEFFNRLVNSFRLFSQHSSQTIVFVVGITELTVNGIETILPVSVDRINIGNFVPSSFTKVDGQTKFCINIVVVRIPATVSIVIIATVNVTFQAVPTCFNVNCEVLVDAELSLQTCTEIHSVEVVGHTATEACTYERNEVENTVFIVTTEHVAEVEHCMTVQDPIFVAYVLSQNIFNILDVFQANGIGANALTPNTLSLQTKTEAGSEPFTNGNSDTGI